MTTDKATAQIERIKEELRQHAIANGCVLSFNRSLGGYQITRGFRASELEYPTYTESKLKILTVEQIARLRSYIY